MEPRHLGAPGNSYGVPEAIVGLFAGFICSILALTAYDSVAHVRSGQSTFGTDVVSLLVLWAGFVGGALAASRWHGSKSLVADFGLRLKPWPDVPLGIVVGVASQYLLVPVLEAPLEPFVPHLSQRLGHPTTQLIGSISGAQLVILTLLVCVGSPLVEELFFRGLLLRALLGRLAPLGRRLGPAASIVITAVIFGLVHFEALQFIGLAGFGVVLCYLAYRTARLGPSIVAHISFNSTTVIWYVWHH